MCRLPTKGFSVALLDPTFTLILMYVRVTSKYTEHFALVSSLNRRGKTVFYKLSVFSQQVHYQIEDFKFT